MHLLHNGVHLYNNVPISFSWLVAFDITYGCGLGVAKHTMWAKRTLFVLDTLQPSSQFLNNAHHPQNLLSKVLFTTTAAFV